MPFNLHSVLIEAYAVTLNWDVPANYLGDVILSYDIYFRLSSDTNFIPAIVDFSVCNSLTCGRVTSLLRGTLYDFEVRAINVDGPSPFSIPILSNVMTHDGIYVFKNLYIFYLFFIYNYNILFIFYKGNCCTDFLAGWFW